MDWTYAKWNSFDHAFVFNVGQEGGKLAGGDRASVVLAA